jgi:uncharacterized coiled-coil protein SlyX
VFIDLFALGMFKTYVTLPFGVDDSASAASSMEVSDRIASLEQRVQMQEDDIQLLKSALADVVRRLNITEEQQAVLNRKGPTKGGHCAGSRTSQSPQRFVLSTMHYTLILTQNHNKTILALPKQ